MKKLFLLTILTSSMMFSHTLEPIIGAKFTGGISYDMEHEYFSGQLGLLYTPKRESVLMTDIGVSGEYVYDHLQEFNGAHNFYVLRVQPSRAVNDFVSLTAYGGYINVLSTAAKESFKPLKSNLAWGLGVRLSDQYMMAEAMYENLAGYPHISVGVHFFLWDLLGNKEY